MEGGTPECSSGESLYVVEPLHKVPFLIDECCDLINKEWKRSHVARKRSIESSSENFPMSLVLIQNTGEFKVVGHCKISKLNNSSSKIFVETVVIHPKLRGQGLGKFLMKHVEKLARRKNIKWIYLSTQGQEVFYEKIGYSRCPPINIYGCQLHSSIENINEIETSSEPLRKEKTRESSSQEMNVSSPRPPPPPPPPLPSSLFSSPTPLSSDKTCAKTYMRKEVIY